jgi:hypothetical protein
MISKMNIRLVLTSYPVICLQTLRSSKRNVGIGSEAFQIRKAYLLNAVHSVNVAATCLMELHR